MKFIKAEMKKKTGIFVIIAAGVFLSLYGETRALLSPAIPRLPKSKDLNPRVISAKMAGAVFFGGFRGIIVDMTWMYIDHLWHHSRFYKLPVLYEFVTAVQPEYIDGWVMGGWHMAYNMSLEIPGVTTLSSQLRKKKELEWVMRGINFLKAGALLNPDNAKIYFEIGWTYYHRLKDYNNSIPWFEKSCEQEGSLEVTSRLIAYALEKSEKKELALKKWLELKKLSSYTDPTTKKIIDKNIIRLSKS